jgi:hypothetical protein
MAFCNADGSISNWNAVAWGTISWHFIVVLMNNVHCCVKDATCCSVLPGCKDQYCIWAWIPTYPIQIIPSYLSWYCVALGISKKMSTEIGWHNIEGPTFMDNPAVTAA